jgi:hypothetical protein
MISEREFVVGFAIVGGVFACLAFWGYLGRSPQSAMIVLAFVGYVFSLFTVWGGDQFSHEGIAIGFLIGFWMLGRLASASLKRRRAAHDAST